MTRRFKLDQIARSGSGRMLALLQSLRIPAGPAAERWGRAIFFAGLLVYLVARLVYSLDLPLLHPLPARNDDQYSYIWKGPQLRYDFLENSPGLVDVAEQVRTKAGTYDEQFHQMQLVGRTLVIYCPLHSLALAILHATGLEWELAHTILIVLGIAFIGLSSAWFLSSFVGYPAAGIALFCIAFTISPKEAFQSVKPSTLSFGLAMCALAFSLRKTDRSYLGMLIFIALSLSMHSVGFIFGSFVLGASVLVNGLPKERLKWVSLGLITGLLITHQVAVHLVAKPPLALHWFPIPEGWTPTLAIKKNLLVAKKTCLKWIQRPGDLMVWVGVILGLLSLPVRRVRAGLVLLPLSLLLFFSSVVWTGLPHLPGELCKRLWALPAMIITGLYGAGLWSSMTVFLRNLTKAASKEGRGWNVQAILLAVVGGAISIWLGLGIFRVVSDDISIRISKQRAMMEGYYYYSYSSAQAESLAKRAGPDDRILYEDDAILPFFWTHGCFRSGASLIKVPPVSGSALVRPRTPSGRLYYAGSNSMFPVENTPKRANVQEDGIIVGRDKVQILATSSSASPIRRVELRLPSPPYGFWGRVFHLSNPATTIELECLHADNSLTKRQVTISQHQPVNLALDEPGEAPVIKVEVQATTGATKPLLSKIISAEDQTTSWPWDKGIEVHLNTKEPTPIIAFISKTLLPGAEIEVLDDSGSTVVALLKNNVYERKQVAATPNGSLLNESP